MRGRLIHYSEPVEFHKALPGAKSIVIWKRDDEFTPAVSRTAKPKNPAKAKSRLAHNEPIDDEIGKPAEKGNNMTNDIDRGPWHKMLDRQALARQQQTGESYASAFTKVYEDPSNRSIVDQAQHEHLAKSHDVMFGTRLSSIPIQKAAPYDPLAKSLAEIRGPAHARLHSMAVDHQRARAGQSYASAYAYLYAKPENEALRNAIKAEHMSATMSAHAEGGIGKAAPPDALQDDVDPGSAEHALHQLVVTRMKNEPGMSYARAFTREYLAPENRSLKARVTSEGILRMQAMEPAKPFPAYGHPGDVDYKNPNIGRSGAKPKGYIGG
jgi:hypothetical protein